MKGQCEKLSQLRFIWPQINIRYSLEAIDVGSFSGAAEKLGYTPSGVVHMMNSLEKEFGFPLFQRSNKGVTLTPDGERIVPVLRGYDAL